MTDDSQLHELQDVFLVEAAQIIEDLEQTLLELERNTSSIDLINTAFRLAHNFKGSAKSVAFSDLATLAHKFEDILSAVRKNEFTLSNSSISVLLKATDKLKSEVEGLRQNRNFKNDVKHEIKLLEEILTNKANPSEAKSAAPTDASQKSEEAVDWSKGFGFFNEDPARVETKKTHPPAVIPEKKHNQIDETLKIPASRLDNLLNIIGELVINQSIIDSFRSRDQLGSTGASQAIAYMSKLVVDIQSLSLALRLVPIRPLFQKLRRTARDVADSLGKSIDFQDIGDHCELDKGVVEKIADPLNHMIRNAIDHGVDTAEERKASGKDPVARIVLEASALEDQIKIIISDDGRGLNKEKIIAKAIAQKIIVPGQNVTDEQAYALIFQPNFSTKEQVSDFSGRGVGMDVVYKAVSDLKGSIKIFSNPGKGTRFEISLPLSLSIISGMVVDVGGSQYVVPVSQLLETIETGKHPVETFTGTARAINLRGEVVPIFRLSDILGQKRKNQEYQRHPALVVMHRDRKVAFEVDHIVNQQKVVLKKLGSEFQGLPGVIAGAVLSTGEAGLILSLELLIARGVQ